MRNIRFKPLFLLSLLLSLLSVTTVSYALPFTIVPAGPLPRFITPGGTAVASYTVTNNTGAQRNNNHVTYLPPNVSVINSAGCTSNFNLAPRGQPGSSCTLYLTVSGAVSAVNPDPHQHLFVCFPGNMTCAGTSFPLNVIPSTNLQQMAYVANATTGANTISICPVIQGRSIGGCTAQSDPTFNRPMDVILNNTATLAYVANAGNNTISVCPVNPLGALQPCQAVAAPVSLFPGLTLNAANTFIYFTQWTTFSVAVCPVNSNGSLGTCVQQSPVIGGPDGRIAFNTAVNLAYIPDNNGVVDICTVNPNGGLGSCASYSDPVFTSGSGGPLGIAIDPTNTYLYVSAYPNIVAICPINPNGTLRPCSSSTGNGTFNFNDDNAINLSIQNINGASYAYIPNGGSTAPAANVSICPIQPGGSFGVCSVFTSTTFDTPDGMSIATLGQFT